MAVDPFAELLRHLRRNANRSQDEQAGAINAASGRATVTRREVNRYENGANVPTDHTLGKFVFADGRLVLRGHNGSGKTKALEVLFPLVLDGVLDARRLDPFSDARWRR
ncbi:MULTISPECIES: helix-turn-helix domain-containing protein [unclassified Streptomyces]|uniref:helix-turn-helix domain-containing protein n=1 Tax=Streptomyces sp. SYP-A7185 TaxID=3040076 RepID=UPI0038F6EED5